MKPAHKVVQEYYKKIAEKTDVALSRGQCGPGVCAPAEQLFESVKLA
jgi:hypothetical protein